MKMKPETFAYLKKVFADYERTFPYLLTNGIRAYWDVLHKTGNWCPLYKEGLDDRHIETALRRIMHEHNAA